MSNQRVLKSLTIAVMITITQTGCITHRNLVVENPCVESKAHEAVTPVPRERAAWMVRHNAVVERIKQGKADVIFVGNSLTQRWESTGADTWNKYYAAYNAVNMGFDGDKTQNVLWRLDHGEIDGISPKLAIVLIGSNHVEGYSAEEIADGIKAVCCRLITRLPDTKILLLSILPRGTATAAAADRLNKASEQASKIADRRRIFYLNISKMFLETDGTVSKDLMTADRVHLTSKGYETLATAINPTVSKLMRGR
ncbi:MAG: GDSL-type esterase/lipase family protein [Daejeonella sp.]